MKERLRRLFHNTEYNGVKLALMCFAKLKTAGVTNTVLRAKKKWKEIINSR